MAETLRLTLNEELAELDAHPLDGLLERRYQRLMGYGHFRE